MHQYLHQTNVSIIYTIKCAIEIVDSAIHLRGYLPINIEFIYNFVIMYEKVVRHYLTKDCMRDHTKPHLI